MATKLDGELRRELSIEDEPYTLILSPIGLKLTEKGRRLGLESNWEDIVSGDAALARALQASVAPAARRPRTKAHKRAGKVVHIRSKKRK